MRRLGYRQKNPASPGRPALVFLSLAAPSSTIKGVRAILNKTTPGAASLSPMYTSDDDSKPPAKRDNLILKPLRKGQQFQRRLGGLAHQHHYLCIAREQPVTLSTDEEASDKDKFHIYAGAEGDGPAAFYRQFIRRSPTPTLPQWAEQIWEFAEDLNFVTKLDSAGLSAWRCEVNYEKLEDSIVQAVRRGHLPIP